MKSVGKTARAAIIEIHAGHHELTPHRNRYPRSRDVAFIESNRHQRPPIVVEGPDVRPGQIRLLDQTIRLLLETCDGSGKAPEERVAKSLDRMDIRRRLCKSHRGGGRSGRGRRPNPPRESPGPCGSGSMPDRSSLGLHDGCSLRECEGSAAHHSGVRRPSGRCDRISQQEVEFRTFPDRGGRPRVRVSPRRPEPASVGSPRAAARSSTPAGGSRENPRASPPHDRCRRSAHSRSHAASRPW